VAAAWAVTVPAVIYEDPLAYLLGLEGVALMRGLIGEYDRDFVISRTLAYGLLTLLPGGAYAAIATLRQRTTR
jgi:hypothetical protein